MNRHPRIRPEDLLAHVEWARALARRLVTDDAAAEDLVQESFSSALRTPPQDRGPLRPWLTRVLGNAARQRARAEGRRRSRERATARHEALPSAAELTERAEGQRILMDAVLALDEARREVVLLRYFEGLSSAEIARRQGVPAGTVRARLKRALDELRERLDTRFGGEREDWRRALAPLAFAPATTPAAVGLASLVTGALLMKIVLGLGALALVGLILVATGAVEGPLRRPPLEPVSFAPLAELSVAEIDATEARARREVAPPTPIAPARTGAPSLVGTVRLRFVDAGGRPVPGVEAVGHPSGGHPAAVSDADGSAVVTARFPPRRAEAHVAFTRFGFASDAISVRGEPGCDLDIGDVRLHAGGAIAGRVVDEDGTPLADVQVRVKGREVRMATGGRRRITRASALGAVRTRTDDDGWFRLAGVLVGEVRVEAESDDELWRGTSGRVEVRAGEESRGLVVVAERVPVADRVEGVVLDPSGEPVPWAPVQARWKTWIRGGSLSGAADREGRFRFVLPKRVALDLVVRDPEDRWTPLAADGVAPGTLDLELRFAEAQTFTVRLVDGAGAPVTRAELRVSAGERFLQVLEGDAADGEFVLRLPSERFDFTVLADGFAAETVAELEPSAMGEVLEVELRALPGLGGRVTAGGAPVEGAVLTVLALARERLFVEGLPAWLARGEQARGTSSGDGSFALTLREPGRYVVRAEAPGYAAAESAPLDYDPAVGVAGLALALDAGGALEGRVIDANGLRETRVVLASRGDGLVLTVRTDPDGRFRFEHLVPGPWMLRVVAEEVTRGHGSSIGEGGRPFTSIEGDCFVAAGRTTVHDLFLGGGGPAVSVAGRLTIANGDAGEWTAALDSLAARVESASVRRTVRLAGDGTFVLEGGAPGRYVLLLTCSDDEGALSVVAELDLAAGETPFALELALGEVVAGPSADAEAERLLWRGPDGTFAFAAFPEDGRSRRFPAGTVERVRLDPTRPTLSDDPRAWPVVEAGTLAAGGTLRVGK